MSGCTRGNGHHQCYRKTRQVGCNERGQDADAEAQAVGLRLGGRSGARPMWQIPCCEACSHLDGTTTLCVDCSNIASCAVFGSWMPDRASPTAAPAWIHRHAASEDFAGATEFTEAFRSGERFGPPDESRAGDRLTMNSLDGIFRLTATRQGLPPANPSPPTRRVRLDLRVSACWTALPGLIAALRLPGGLESR